ncbi:hypothetical protein [Mycolicibacterium holsaticum]|uniref:hypothetical protein n=1 Tax=Mycolicibacterium holsaticum TaxID=152142 RepID=UPI001C7D302D|nr:hypothetical protein [Mycolicibacterium holsaticum]MDA4109946.1 hypothetical protein [Mycolicibacterium holsaticum DSM 44478 = JCM 12374]QZA12125.1 hypothetical protein K3U96_23770 [Mycolicibacterium holsaticum DSM 44478 = JCM 12374]UNC10389.1 hypothetical protein H5U41_03040 [Mycolicibacterium holsaticum DSM 44478 = JCM 12374]
MSRRTDAKKARRRKRRAARDERWVPYSVMDAMSEDIELAAVLEEFDKRITERGWVFDDESSDDESALWCYPPSQADVVDDEIVDMTTIVLVAADGADVVHVVFVGTSDDYQFGFEELFENLDAVEAYRSGDPRPVFGS